MTWSTSVNLNEPSPVNAKQKLLRKLLCGPHRFLLIFEGGPELLQFRRDRRPGQLQGFDDVSCVSNLILSDEGVGVTLS